MGLVGFPNAMYRVWGPFSPRFGSIGIDDGWSMIDYSNAPPTLPPSIINSQSAIINQGLPLMFVSRVPA
jgi:hypothetical protein